MNKFTVILTVTCYAVLTAQELAARFKIGLTNHKGGYKNVRRNLKNLQISRWAVLADADRQPDETGMLAYELQAEMSFQTELTESDINDDLIIYFGSRVSPDGLKNKNGEIIAEITDYIEWQVIEEMKEPVLIQADSETGAEI